jgi:hypothetical protein
MERPTMKLTNFLINTETGGYERNALLLQAEYIIIHAKQDIALQHHRPLI